MNTHCILLWWSFILHFITRKIKHQNCAVCAALWWAREWSGGLLQKPKHKTIKLLLIARDDLMYYACVVERLFILNCSAAPLIILFFIIGLLVILCFPNHTHCIYTLESNNNESHTRFNSTRVCSSEYRVHSHKY